MDLSSPGPNKSIHLTAGGPDFAGLLVKKLTRWAKTKWGGKTGPNLLKEHFL